MEVNNEIIITPTMTQRGLEMDMDKEQFAMALRTWRLRQGKTQREVAKMFGVSRCTIIRAENAQGITWEMAYRLFARLAEQLRKEGQNG